MIAALLTDVASRIFMKIMNYNLFLIPIFGFIELSIFSIIYYKHIYKTKSKLLWFIIALTFLLIFQDLFFRDQLFDPSRFNSFGKVISDLVILFFALSYIIQGVNKTSPLRKDYLILSFVLLFYFSINMLFTISVNFLVNEQISIVIVFWVMNLIFTLLFYVALIYLLWQNGKIQKRLQ